MRYVFIPENGEQPGFHIAPGQVRASRLPRFGQCFLGDILAQAPAAELDGECPDMGQETEEFDFERLINRRLR